MKIERNKMNKILLSLLMIVGLPQIILCEGEVLGIMIDAKTIVDYVDARDKADVLLLLQQNWQLLGFGNYNDTILYVDAIACNQCSTKIFKVLRQFDKMIGFISYYQKSLEHWHVAFLVVDQDYRHQGHASMMMQLAIDEMKVAGIEKITIRVRAENKIAYELYTEKFGFQPFNYLGENKAFELVLYVNDIICC